MIKAVIFDFGNVISMPQSGECYKQMEKRTGVSADVFGSSFYKFRSRFDAGEIDGKTLYSLILKDNGYDALARDEELCAEIARYDMDSWRFINTDVSDWALSLKKSGYKLGILSNMPYEFLDTYEKDIPPFVEADQAVFSCRVKMCKPEPAIYRIVLERLGVQAEEAVFFDDIQENIEAAAKLGLKTVLWQNLADAQQRFQKIIDGQ